jgi:hypothetical protein
VFVLQANLPRRYVVITTPHQRITVWHREPYEPAMVGAVLPGLLAN